MEIIHVLYAISYYSPDYNCSGIANNPVCGSDGLTYGNDCERNKKGVQLKKSGSCFSEFHVICTEHSVINLLFWNDFEVTDFI